MSINIVLRLAGVAYARRGRGALGDTVSSVISRTLPRWGARRMDERSSEEPNPEDASALIDLGNISLDDLARLDNSVLAHSLSRVLGDVNNPDAVVLASFSAAV